MKTEDAFENLLDCFNSEKDLEKKQTLMELIERLHEVNAAIDKARLAERKLDADIDFKIEENKLAEMRLEYDKSLASKNEAKETEETEHKRKLEILNLEAEQRKLIKDIVTCVFGGVITIAAAVIPVLGWRRIFAGLKDWDNSDMIPTSIGWNVFSKNVKMK